MGFIAGSMHRYRHSSIRRKQLLHAWSCHMTVRLASYRSTLPTKPSSPHTHECLAPSRCPSATSLFCGPCMPPFPLAHTGSACREERHNLLQQAMSGGVENLIPACLPSSLWLAATQSIMDMEDRETAPDR